MKRRKVAAKAQGAGQPRTFDVQRTAWGAQLVLDGFGLLLSAQARVRDRIVKGAVSVYRTRGDQEALLYRDSLTLTSVKSRRQFINVAVRRIFPEEAADEALRELDAVLERALLALEEAIRRSPAPEMPSAVIAKTLAELEQEAAPVLGAVDPIERIRAAIVALGYGGDVKPALIVYLAATGRVLAMRAGTMPVHLLLVGIPSVGKSFTLKIVLRLLPDEAYHMIDAGSPHVLIYDDVDLRHRAVVFSEADSLPAGEDNPAASAVRNLLQEHQLTYKVVRRDGETGQYGVQDIVRPGPTTLLTTAVRRLGAQLDTRLFTLEAPDDIQHVRAALETQAQIEIKGTRAQPDPALIAFQSYLQARAPWEVVVPFADALSTELGRSMPVPRILRDYQKLLSFVKAVTVLRHRQRQQDAEGRWIATVDDYRVVYDLVQDLYEGSASGASRQVREAVEAVEKMAGTNAGATVTVRQVAKALQLSDMAAWRRVRAAVERGWLNNLEERERRPARLRPSEEPLPPRAGLPAPDRLMPPRIPLRQPVRPPSSPDGSGPAITPEKVDPPVLVP